MHVGNAYPPPRRTHEPEIPLLLWRIGKFSMGTEGISGISETSYGSRVQLVQKQRRNGRPRALMVNVL